MKVQKPDEKLIVAFSTNSFSENPMNVIGMAFGAGMGSMFVGILLGAPILLSMILLFGGILAVYGYKIGDTRYELYPSGIYQEIRLFIPHALSRPPKRRFIQWKDIRSFKHDNEMSRSLEGYEFIKLYLKRSPGQIWITNQKNKTGFEDFRDAFLELMDEPHQQSDVDIPSSKQKTKAVHTQSSNPIAKIRRKPSFYQGWLAKFITLALVAMTIALFYFGIKNGMRSGNWFRLAAIIVPGTMYMLYRVFLTKPK